MILGLDQVLTSFWTQFVTWLPGFVAALIVLVIGFIVGRIVAKVVKEVLIRAKVDEWTNMEEDKFSIKFSDVFSIVAKWVIYLVFLQQATFYLQIQVVSSFINNVVSIIPGLIEAALLIIVGYVIAMFLKERILSSKTLHADLVGNVVFLLIMYVSIALALPFVGINTVLINNILLVFIGSLGLGFAIALGLGLKDTIAKLSASYTGRFKKRVARRRR